MKKIFNDDRLFRPIKDYNKAIKNGFKPVGNKIKIRAGVLVFPNFKELLDEARKKMPENEFIFLIVNDDVYRGTTFQLYKK